MNAFIETLLGPFVRPQTYKDLLYVALAFPIGLATFLAVTVGLAVGLSLLVVIVGIPLIWAVIVATTWIGKADAMFANGLIGARIELHEPARPAGNFLERAWGLISHRTAWTSVAWGVLRLPLGILALIAVIIFPALVFTLVVHPIFGVLDDANIVVRLMSMLGGVAALFLFPHVLRGIAALHASAARQLLGVTDAERLREQTRRAQQAETRTDIARELHDSVGHSVTAAVLQASAARRVLTDDPAYADRALAAIEEQGRAALEELDRVLALMRDDGSADKSVHNLTTVHTLVETARSAGQPVTVTRSGALDEVPPTVSLAGYRVVQEGLTNAMRHAPGAPTALTIDADNLRVMIDIVNGAGTMDTPQRDGGGYGLEGVQERVRALGGTLTAGPIDDGFRLHAEIPLRTGT